MSVITVPEAYITAVMCWLRETSPGIRGYCCSHVPTGEHPVEVFVPMCVFVCVCVCKCESTYSVWDLDPNEWSAGALMSNSSHPQQ